MSKYDFLCPNCGIIEIEHSMEREHPTRCPECHAPIKRYMGETTGANIVFVESRGGGIDDWSRKVFKGRREPSSPEKNVPYH